jgi:RNA polymerase sigma-70 factor, ECF subfamily
MLRSTASVPLSDEDLACRAQQGCTASFEQLLRRFQTPILHFLRHRGSAADAEDLTQETFLRAYRNLHRYQCRWTFSAWLFTIARRISINHRRRRRPTLDAAAVATAFARAPEPLDALLAAERQSRLWDLAAGALAEEQVTALWLHYVEQMPLRAIAMVLRRSPASVKVMLFRARRKLLPLLGGFVDDHQTETGNRTHLATAGTAANSKTPLTASGDQGD